MITRVRALIYSSDPAATIAFFRDVLEFDMGDEAEGWSPIVSLPPADLSVAYADEKGAGAHRTYLMCDDIAATVGKLRRKGIEVTDPVDYGWGVMSLIDLPAGGELGIFESRKTASPSS